VTDTFAKVVDLALLERGLFSDKMRTQHRELSAVSNTALQWLRMTMIEMYRAGWDDAAANRQAKFPTNALTDWEMTWLGVEEHVNLTPTEFKQKVNSRIRFA
jgi:hypothetical protein